MEYGLWILTAIMMIWASIKVFLMTKEPKPPTNRTSGHWHRSR